MQPPPALTVSRETEAQDGRPCPKSLSDTLRRQVRLRAPDSGPDPGGRGPRRPHLLSCPGAPGSATFRQRWDEEACTFPA